MPTADELSVQPAQWPRDAQSATALLAEYFRWLAKNPAVPASIRSIDRTAELESVQARYDGVSAVLLVLWRGAEAVGCVTLRRLDVPAASMEVKRLYVAPTARGRGAGRILLQGAIDFAWEAGVGELLLDTLPAAMPDAVRLYQACGFEPTGRYNSNDGPEFAFFRLNLG